MRKLFVLLILCIWLVLPSANCEENKVVEIKAKGTDCTKPGGNFNVTIEIVPKEDGNYSVRLEERVTKYKFIDPPNGEKYDEDLKADEKQIFRFELESNKSNLDYGSTFKVGYIVLKNGKQILPDKEGEWEHITIKIVKKEDNGFIPAFETIYIVIALIISFTVIQKRHN